MQKVYLMALPRVNILQRDNIQLIQNVKLSPLSLKYHVFRMSLK